MSEHSWKNIYNLSTDQLNDLDEEFKNNQLIWLVLNKYSKWRNLDVTSVVFFTDFANKIFSNDNFLKKFATGIGFKLLNESKQT